MKTETKKRIEAARRGEVPSGYKRTIGGIMPKGWDAKSLGDICEVNPSRDENIPDEVTFIGMADVSENGQIENQRKVDYIRVSKGFTPFRKGDILVAKITPCFENGKGAHTDILLTEYGFGSTEFHVLRSFGCSKFLFYHTITETFRKRMTSEMSGSAGQRRISRDSLSSYIIPIPPLPEQEKIAEILTTCDRVLTLKKELLEEKKKRKQWLLQNLLNPQSGVRLPGFRGKWKMVKLEDVCDGFDYGMNVAATEFDGENAYIRITDIDELSRKYQKEEAVSPCGNLSDCYLVKENDILFARTGASVGKTYLYDSGDGKLYFAGFLIRVNVARASASYVYFWTFTEKYNKWTKTMSMRSGQPGINAQEYRSFTIQLPPLPEQTAIAEVLSTADREISLLQEEIQAWELKKKALMQLLLTGIVRVI